MDAGVVEVPTPRRYTSPPTRSTIVMHCPRERLHVVSVFSTTCLVSMALCPGSGFMRSHNDFLFLFAELGLIESDCWLPYLLRDPSQDERFCRAAPVSELLRCQCPRERS